MMVMGAEIAQATDRCDGRGEAVLEEQDEFYLHHSSVYNVDMSNFETHVRDAEASMVSVGNWIRGWAPISNKSTEIEGMTFRNISQYFPQVEDSRIGIMSGKREDVHSGCVINGGRLPAVLNGNGDEFIRFMKAVDLTQLYTHVELNQDMMFSPQDGRMLVAVKPRWTNQQLQALSTVMLTKLDSETKELNYPPPGSGVEKAIPYVCLMPPAQNYKGTMARTVKSGATILQRVVDEFRRWKIKYDKIKEDTRAGGALGTGIRRVITLPANLDMARNLIGTLLGRRRPRLSWKDATRMVNVAQAIKRFLTGHRFEGIQMNTGLVSPASPMGASIKAVVEPVQRAGEMVRFKASSLDEDRAERVVVFTIQSLLDKNGELILDKFVVVRDGKASSGTQVVPVQCHTGMRGKQFCERIDVVGKDRSCGRRLYYGETGTCARHRMETFKILKPDCTMFRDQQVVVSTSKFVGIRSCGSTSETITVQTGNSVQPLNCTLRTVTGDEAGEGISNQKDGNLFQRVHVKPQIINVDNIGTTMDLTNVRALGLLAMAVGMFLIIFGAIVAMGLAGFRMTLRWWARQRAACETPEVGVALVPVPTAPVPIPPSTNPYRPNMLMSHHH